MMMNLFSSFDPTSNFKLNLNWLSTMLGIFMLYPLYWMMPARSNFIWMKIIKTLHKEFKILTKNMKGMTLIFNSTFTFILMNNFIGMFPYIFTSTSHMVMTIAMALPIWTSFMLYGWVNNYTHMLAHLIPQGTPPILMPFMVCVETISNIIRPGTLAIRLTANMIAGHLLLTLLSSLGPSLSFLSSGMLISSQILLLILEYAVAIIQSYVFATLITLYFSEVN